MKAKILNFSSLTRNIIQMMALDDQAFSIMERCWFLLSICLSLLSHITIRKWVVVSLFLFFNFHSFFDIVRCIFFDLSILWFYRALWVCVLCVWFLMILTFRMPAAICLLSSKGLWIVCNQQTKEQSASAYLKSQAIINIIGGYCFSQKLFADSLFWFNWFFLEIFECHTFTIGL